MQTLQNYMYGNLVHLYIFNVTENPRARGLHNQYRSCFKNSNHFYCIVCRQWKKKISFGIVNLVLDWQYPANTSNFHLSLGCLSLFYPNKLSLMSNLEAPSKTQIMMMSLQGENSLLLCHSNENTFFNS